MQKKSIVFILTLLCFAAAALAQQPPSQPMTSHCREKYSV